MTRQLFPALVLWIVLTIVGEILTAQANFYPTVMSDKGEHIATAFRILTFLAVPVFTMVIAVLVSSTLLNSSMSFPEEDGPPQMGQGAVPMLWVGVTGCLAIAVMIYPGLIELPKVFKRADKPDVRVHVEGVQWTWLVSYPDAKVDNAREVVLPVDRTVRFDITSRDVLHSFWIPAFLLKIDAVPGLTTTISLKPTRTGTYQADPLLRLQCSQLCGLSHSRMRLPVRVVTQAEYDAWVQAQSGGAAGGPTPTGPAATITITAKNIAFDQSTLTVAAGSAVQLTLDNQDSGIPHNWSLYKSKDAAVSGDSPLAGTKIEAGPVKETTTFAAPAAGTYYFRCDVHPTTMTGTFVVQ